MALSFLSVFISIFVIVNVTGIVPVYISLTEKFSKTAKKKIINTAVITASVILISFAFFGNLIFVYLNISIESFQIAGGILLFLIAIDMLFARRSRTVHSEEQEKEAQERENIAIFPIAIPFLTGPGAITTVITLMNISETSTEKIIIFVSIILTFAIAKIVLDKSSVILHYMGKTGIQVITRIMGILVASIGVQFIMDGIRGVLLAGA